MSYTGRTVDHKMKRRKKRIAGLITALIIVFAADVLMFYIAGMPRLEDAVEQNSWNGIDLRSKYLENTDMVGWLQVEGTGINYPVMRGDDYLRRNFRKERDVSGSLFVESDWREEDICTVIYGHNMWMYGTMLNPLHRFTDYDFFRRNRIIKFYVINDSGRSVEKRTYEIMCCIRTRVDEWNYASCQYICSNEELSTFLEECGNRALLKREPEVEPGEVIVLSTCSYHVGGGKGRLLLIGGLMSRKDQNRVDMQQNEDYSATKN